MRNLIYKILIKIGWLAPDHRIYLIIYLDKGVPRFQYYFNEGWAIENAYQISKKLTKKQKESLTIHTYSGVDVSRGSIVHEKSETLSSIAQSGSK